MSAGKPTDFLFNSDYEMDQIVWAYEAKDQTGQDLVIDHKLPFTPLVFGVWATSSDFSDSRLMTSTMNATDPAVMVMADSSKVYAAITHASAPKISIRLYAFEPSNSNANVGATSKSGNKFLFNTDYNYCKLLKSGMIETNPSAAVSEAVEHNLGYIPQTLVWELVNTFNPLGQLGLFMMQVENAIYTDMDMVTVTENSVTITAPSYKPVQEIHYRIYYDKA